MTQQEIQNLIVKIDNRIEFLKTDKTVWTMAWAGSTYNHGPYLRKLEIRKLKAKRKNLEKKLPKC
jgi:hypothetical protein